MVMREARDTQASQCVGHSGSLRDHNTTVCAGGTGITATPLCAGKDNRVQKKIIKYYLVRVSAN